MWNLHVSNTAETRIYENEFTSLLVKNMFTNEYFLPSEMHIVGIIFQQPNLEIGGWKK